MCCVENGLGFKEVFIIVFVFYSIYFGFSYILVFGSIWFVCIEFFFLYVVEG